MGIILILVDISVVKVILADSRVGENRALWIQGSIFALSHLQIHVLWIQGTNMFFLQLQLCKILL